MRTFPVCQCINSVSQSRRFCSFQCVCVTVCVSTSVTITVHNLYSSTSCLIVTLFCAPVNRLMILMRTSLERLKTKKRAGHLPVKLTCFHSRTWVAELLFRPLVKESNAPDMDRQCDQVLECVMSDAHLVPKVISGKRCNDPRSGPGSGTRSLGACVAGASGRAGTFRSRSRAPRLPRSLSFAPAWRNQPEALEALESRTARENGDSQECAHELDAGPGLRSCRSATNFTGCLVYDMPTGEDRPRQCRVDDWPSASVPRSARETPTTSSCGSAR